jgi:hypothetical protein
MMDQSSCYDVPMTRQEKLRAASHAAAQARVLAKQRRWAEEMRAAGWKVEEPQK